MDRIDLHFQYFGVPDWQPHPCVNHLIGLSLSLPDGAAQPMLWTIFVILLILWLVGWIGFHVTAWFIHLLLIAAVIVLIIRLISGRRAI